MIVSKDVGRYFFKFNCRRCSLRQSFVITFCISESLQTTDPQVLLPGILSNRRHDNDISFPLAIVLLLFTSSWYQLSIKFPSSAWPLHELQKKTIEALTDVGNSRQLVAVGPFLTIRNTWPVTMVTGSVSKIKRKSCSRSHWNGNAFRELLSHAAGQQDV